MPARYRVTLAMAACVIASLGVGCSSTSDGSAPDRSTSSLGESVATVGGDPGEFVEIMAEANSADAFVYPSIAAIEAASDLVVRGRLGPAQEGRRLWPEGADPGTTDHPDPALITVVFELEVTEVLGGSHPELADERFYVEAFQPRNLSPAEVASVTPVGADVLLFLTDYTAPEGMVIEGAEDDVDYLFPHQQGFVLEHEDTLESVLGGLIEPAGYATLDEAVLDLRALG